MATNWEVRRRRLAEFHANQKNTALPVCVNCHKRFIPEHIGQDACSNFCFRQFVIRGKGRK